ncbi:Geranylgeranyl pyrophosphate synthase [Elusimicrobium minutum Pei191]|uniref:Geranylgeranyl pyrophosphate synthase n=1 Tax=Elusimicrobium minutum (strain Pei191) TaxID=445932 RepID=B2KBS5_ELUMP|nr:polyprenyl synthetase family protein [Elusimicrobium minutum]ACC97829.1 Geranylgeranyl pyrophosphate synthase [Elusimicrobium minutum Pei191]
MNEFEKYLKTKAAFVEKGLSKYILKIANSPEVIKDSMAYSLEAGGKRVRPVLVMAAAEAFGKKAADVMPAACAVEMVHTYSLIHDDLPSMDNDSLRRGKPTNHKVYGEDLALLAGDALLTYAFEVFAQNGDVKSIGHKNTLKALQLFANGVGSEGMVGGQVTDIYAEGLIEGKFKRITAVKKESKALSKKSVKYFLMPAKLKEVSAETVLSYIHANKTGALIRSSIEAGAVLAGASEADRANMRKYGNAMGLAFQIVDDILDVTVSEKKLGKSGSDKENAKLTFVSLYGLEVSRKYAKAVLGEAVNALNKVKAINKKKAAPLYEMADFFLTRSM